MASIRRWLGHHLPAAAADEAAAMAEAEASRWAGVSLVAKVSPPAARQLQTCGLPLDVPLPLLSEMVSARAVSNHPAVAALRPKDDSVLEAARSLFDRLAPPAPIDPATPPRVLLLLARYQEDVGWLGRVPPGVTFHVVQKGGALQPELPQEQQSLLPNVGRESHSYLRFLAERAHDLAAPLPPLLVLAQADLP